MEISASRWAIEQFGTQAAEVIRRVVGSLTEAHRRGLAAQAEARLKTKHPYGGTWTAKYELLVEALKDLPGAEVFRPRGASFELIKLNGHVLIPFRHATTLDQPIKAARITNKIPLRVADTFEPLPLQPTLFDEESDEEHAAVADAVADIDPSTPIVYIAFVCNVDSDRLLGVWWGLAPHRDDDGRLNWNPEQLPAEAITARPGKPVVTPSGRETSGPSFDQGELPPVIFTPREVPTDAPPSEPEPQGPAAADNDE